MNEEAAQRAIVSKKAKQAERAAMDLMEWTRADAIRAKCLECTNRQPGEVKDCLIDDCELYIYRLGTKISAQECKAWQDRFTATSFFKWLQVYRRETKGTETDGKSE